MSDGIVIGFKIESVTEKGKKAIRKNAKIPFILKSIWEFHILSEEPLRIMIKLKKKFFKKDKASPIKRLVINSSNGLIEAIKNEMLKFECFETIDYVLEVMKENE